jgi:hypothetical protein
MGRDEEDDVRSENSRKMNLSSTTTEASQLKIMVPLENREKRELLGHQYHHHLHIEEENNSMNVTMSSIVGAIQDIRIVQQ